MNLIQKRVSELASKQQMMMLLFPLEMQVIKCYQITSKWSNPTQKFFFNLGRAIAGQKSFDNPIDSHQVLDRVKLRTGSPIRDFFDRE